MTLRAVRCPVLVAFALAFAGLVLVALAPTAGAARANTTLRGVHSVSTRHAALPHISHAVATRGAARAPRGPRAPATIASRAAKTVTTTVTASETPVPVADSTLPPPGRFLSSDRVIEIANRLPKLRAARAEFPGSYPAAYTKGPDRWQVSYFSRRGQEIAQAIVADHTGDVLEQWTGFQIAWTMARGYPGAFGRHVNALYIWIPLCVLFFVPFFDWRRPLRLLHLDLLVLLSFSISLAFFNHGHVYVSTPLEYPPLIYLLVRMLVLARVGRRAAASTNGHAPAVSPGGSSPVRGSAGEPRVGDGPVVALELHSGLARPGGALALPASVPAPDGATPPGGGVPFGHPARPLRLLVPVPYLAVAVVLLLGFRIALNAIDSNVIDVGYAGVIGAHRIVHDRSLYGGWPSENEHGDTYGPVNYEAYVPFVQALGWSGHWDELPAAHGAAIFFDVLCVALLFALGWRVRGPSLGVVLAYAWVSFPFTLYALESNSNDALVCALVLAALLVASSPPARGAFSALAGLTKFAPLALAPLMCTHGLGPLSAARRARAVALFALAFAVTAAVVSIPALTHDTLHTIFQRTIAYQDQRESPFSIWGLYSGPFHIGETSWELAQAAVQGAAIALAIALAFLPRRADVVGLAAAAAAILLAVQIGIGYWFYLYIPWFFGAAIFALLAELSPPRPARRVPVAASTPARSSQLQAA